jgi:hypothetical protein
MHRVVPGFRTLHFGDVVDVHLLDDERDNNAVIADKLTRLLVGQFSVVESARLRFAMEIAVETADSLIKLAFRRHADGDPAVLAEAKFLIRDYLQRLEFRGYAAAAWQVGQVAGICWGRACSGVRSWYSEIVMSWRSLVIMSS